MGYTTDFTGGFEISPALTQEQIAYLNKFAETRRMKRNEMLTVKREDPVRLAVGLPVGPEGAYFVGETGFAGQDNGPDIVDHNTRPTSQPGLWCQWVPNEKGTALEWDMGEKFYDYVEWLQYLIENFFKPWDRTLNGEVIWQGEEREDTGKIIVEGNVVRTLQGKIVYEENQDDFFVPKVN